MTGSIQLPPVKKRRKRGDASLLPMQKHDLPSVSRWWTFKTIKDH